MCFKLEYLFNKAESVAEFIKADIAFTFDVQKINLRKRNRCFIKHVNK